MAAPRYLFNPFVREKAEKGSIADRDGMDGPAKYRWPPAPGPPTGRDLGARVEAPALRLRTFSIRFLCSFALASPLMSPWSGLVGRVWACAYPRPSVVCRTGPYWLVVGCWFMAMRPRCAVSLFPSPVPLPSLPYLPALPCLPAFPASRPSLPSQ